jgi:hypothetical protein
MFRPAGFLSMNYKLIEIFAPSSCLFLAGDVYGRGLACIVGCTWWASLYVTVRVDDVFILLL